MARARHERPSDGPHFERERAAYARGLAPVAGCDEAGRGPLAGPVVAAAVILDPDHIPAGIDDSKALHPARREELYAAILATAEVAVATAPPRRIERDDIRKATHFALCRAVAALPRRPAFVLVDGHEWPAGLVCDGVPVIGGDALSLSVAAASIVAKVTRDRLMTVVCGAHPGYGFSAHKGYATAGHLAALNRLGPCIHHRRSFAPVAQLSFALPEPAAGG